MSNKTPKSLRLQIAIFGRTNVGKSTFLNLVAGQDVAITSDRPGTTTDVVEKPMELLPIGPILLLDTAGLMDTTELGELRMARTEKVFGRADIVLLLTADGEWGETEKWVCQKAAANQTPIIAVVTKSDRQMPSPDFVAELQKITENSVVISRPDARENVLTQLKSAILAVVPDDFVQPPPLVGDLVAPGDKIVLMIPIDKQAPKGRLILPEEQTIRDALDNGAIPVVARDSEYQSALASLTELPKLAVGDSQAVHLLTEYTPESIPTTTFSVLFSRLKADIVTMARGAAAIANLQDGDQVMIAEACCHHPAEDDIGRVKIPRLLSQKTGKKLTFKVVAGRDYPDDVSDYALIVHCGSCMLTRRETLYRAHLAEECGVPITNYGMAISYCRGVLERVLSPFPAALQAFRNGVKTTAAAK